MASGGKCIICSHHNYNDTAVKLYSFPSDKTKMDQWRKAVSANYSFLSPSKRSFICALHFEPECVAESGELSEDALPSVWLEYSETEDGYMRGKKRNRKSSTRKSAAEENSDNEETKEESVTVMPDIVLPDDFVPHQSDEAEQKKKSPRDREASARKAPRRKSAVVVVPKESADPEYSQVRDDSDESNDDDDGEDRFTKRPRNVKVKKEVAEKRPPKPFEIYVSEPTSKTKYTAECITCEKHMFDSTQIVMHIKDEHLQAQGSFQCRICMEKFAFLFACQNHLVLHLDGQFS